MMSLESANFLNPERQELINWFSRNAPGLGKLYEGTLHLIHMDGFPGRVRFMAHAIREIGNRLPDVIAGPHGGGSLQYKNRLDDITDVWKRYRLPIDGSIPVRVTASDELPTGTEIPGELRKEWQRVENELPTGTEIPLPQDLYKKIARLICDHDKSREKRYEAARRLFQAIDNRNKEAEELLRPRIGNWIDITDWFRGYVHKWNLVDDDMDVEELRRRFEVFESTLIALVASFFRTTDKLDEILEEANS